MTTRGVAHEHDWLEITVVGEACRRFICSGCDARKQEDAPSLSEIWRSAAEMFGYEPASAAELERTMINGSKFAELGIEIVDGPPLYVIASSDDHFEVDD